MPAPERNPTFHPFGPQLPTLKGMTPQEQARLDTHERIQGVWALLLKLSTAHVARLRKQKITAPAEDLLQALTVALLEQDEKWDPARGNYTTFVNMIWRKVRQRHDETREVVLAPNHAYATLQKLRKLREAGTLPQSKKQTLTGLEGVYQVFAPLEENP